MSKRTCGQVLVLPSRRLVRPVADYDFVLVLLGDRFLSNVFFGCFWISFHDSTAQLFPTPFLLSSRRFKSITEIKLIEREPLFHPHFICVGFTALYYRRCS